MRLHSTYRHFFAFALSNSGAVLVNRSHKLFPILASYTGYELSTTIDEHVEVVMNKEIGVYLH